MKIKPILFNTEMVRAILEGRKTVTRRVVKPNYRGNEIGFNVITNAHTGEYVRIEYFDEWENETRYMPEPYRPGDILYVRETWGDYSECQPGGAGYYLYRADYPDNAKTYDFDGHICDLPRWRPSIHMPREAARIFLRVTGVQVDRLNNIAPQDIRNEGMEFDMEHPVASYKRFVDLWGSIIKPADRALYGWEANPWCWVIGLKRISKDNVNDEQTD